MAGLTPQSDGERPDPRSGDPLRISIWVAGSVVGTISIHASGLDSSDVAECERVLIATSALLGKELTIRREGGVHRAPRATQRPKPPAAPDKGTTGLLVGESRALQEALAAVLRAARTGDAVLIRGETGTEKQTVARMIHDRSSRSNRPFVAVDTTGTDANRMAMQIFGQEHESPQGPIERTLGQIDEAGTGTLYLDDIAALSLQAQARLLTLVVENRLRRFGSTQSIATDLRLIAATSLPLEDLVSTGLFRRDLFYAITGCTIVLPPLRTRGHDIVLLAEHLLAEYATLKGRSVHRMSAEVVKAILAYSWPRNLQELEEVTMGAASRARGAAITRVHLPQHLALPSLALEAEGATALDAPHGVTRRR